MKQKQEKPATRPAKEEEEELEGIGSRVDLHPGLGLLDERRIEVGLWLSSERERVEIDFILGDHSSFSRRMGSKIDKHLLVLTVLYLCRIRRSSRTYCMISNLKLVKREACFFFFFFLLFRF